MLASPRLVALFAAGAFAVLGGSLAQAQEKMDGSDYHPLMMNSPSSAEIQAGAMAAARPDGNEPIGQSTAMPPPKVPMADSEVYAGALAAAHPTGTEAIGQSTSLPMMKSAH